MKKLVSVLVCLMALPIAFAYWSHDVTELSLVQKDSAWNEVGPGKGVVTFTAITKHGVTIQERVRVSVWNLAPKTKYQLIYYGDETHNDVWNYATCIGRPQRTSTHGYFKGSSWNYDFSGFLNDDVPQKLWVVPATDVDCDAGRMIAWNPSGYLFEHATI